jgi:hypothetical protein
MRVLLATVLYCFAAIVPADAHSGRIHRGLSPAAMLGPGLIHMLQSMTRPRAWCGWYMRQIEHVADPAFNRAVEWTHYGHRAAMPAPGVIVVWPHHVGVIRGGPDTAGAWLIESGNDGGTVRRRFRSLARAIALRAGGDRR